MDLVQIGLGWDSAAMVVAAVDSLQPPHPPEAPEAGNIRVVALLDTPLLRDSPGPSTWNPWTGEVSGLGIEVLKESTRLREQTLHLLDSIIASNLER